MRTPCGGTANIGANGEYYFTLVRYNTSGTLDSSFGTSGIVGTSMGVNVSAEAYALALNSGEKVFAVGYTNDARKDITVVRYNSDGSK